MPILNTILTNNQNTISKNRTLSQQHKTLIHISLNGSVCTDWAEGKTGFSPCNLALAAAVWMISEIPLPSTKLAREEIASSLSLTKGCNLHSSAIRREKKEFFALYGKQIEKYPTI